MVTKILYSIIFPLIALIIFILYKNLKAVDEFLKSKLKLNIPFLRKIYNADKAKGDIFNQYHHDSIEEWVAWLNEQPETFRLQSYAKLLDYLQENPATWHQENLANTLQAVYLIKQEESISILEDFLSVAHRFLSDHRVLIDNYAVAINYLIQLDEPKAAEIMLEELSLAKNKELIVKEIYQIIIGFTPATENLDLSPVLVEMLGSEDLSSSQRQKLLKYINKNFEQNKTYILSEAVSQFKSKNEELSKESKKFFPLLFTEIVGKYSDDNIDELIDICKHDKLYKLSIPVVGSALSDRSLNLSINNIFKIYCVAIYNKESSRNFLNYLAKRNQLTYKELMLTRAFDIRELFPFRKSHLNTEKLTEPINLPLDLISFQEKVADYLAPTVSRNQSQKQDFESSDGGGVILTGLSDTEKLYTARSIAADMKWRFIYVNYQDMIEYSEDFDKLTEEVNISPQALIYVDDLDYVKHDEQKLLFKLLRKFKSENNLVYFVGNILDIDEEHLAEIGVDEKLFPAVLPVPVCDYQKQSKIWSKVLLELDDKRGKTNVSEDNILVSNYKIYSFEFDVYIRTYFHISLLIFGKLVNLEEMKKIGVF